MTISLTVTVRDNTQSNESLRAAGIVPAVVYGPKHTPEKIAVDGKSLQKVITDAGESAIISLKGLSGPVEVLLKEVDFDPVRKRLTHADFYAIERGKEITTHVPIEFIGEAPAEKTGAGVVTKTLHEVEVTCRPSKLPHHIEVDISSLIDAESKITLADISIPDGVSLEHDLTETVAVVSVVKEEEETTAGEIDMDAIAVEAKGKEEGE